MSRYHTSASGKSAGQLVVCRAKVFCRNGGTHHDAALVKEISKETFTPIQDLKESDIKVYQETHDFHAPKKSKKDANYDDSNDFVLQKFGAGYVKVWVNKRGISERGDDKPAMIHENGTQTWFKDGKIGRDGDKPAKIDKDGTQSWFKDGKLHRDGDQPAVISADGSKAWYKDGKLGRDDDQPAVISSDGSQSWYKDGGLWRDDEKPTMVRASGMQVWHKPGSRLGVIHRDGGKPAVISFDGKEKYFIDGQEVDAPRKS